MSIKVGIVCEGITDYRILKYITERYLRDLDVYVIPLKPKETTQGTQDGFGSWTGVLSYIKGDDGMLLEAINEGCSYVIVHIDTDVCDQYGVARSNLDDSQLHSAVIKRLLAEIPPEFDRRKLIFAIAINETECWLLPFLSSDNKVCSRTHSCVETLNRTYKSGGYIDPKNKNAEGARKVYNDILKNIKKPKDIISVSRYNYGFAYFIDTLDRLRSDTDA